MAHRIYPVNANGTTNIYDRLDKAFRGAFDGSFVLQGVDDGGAKMRVYQINRTAVFVRQVPRGDVSVELIQSDRACDKTKSMIEEALSSSILTFNIGLVDSEAAVA